MQHIAPLIALIGTAAFTLWVLAWLFFFPVVGILWMLGWLH